MKNIIVALFLLVAIGLQAQTGTIRGKVVEDETGYEVIGGNVFVEGNESTGTVTDIDGTFEMNLAPGTYNIVSSYLGFDNKIIPNVTVVAGEVTVLDEIRMGESSIEIVGEDGEVVTIVARQLRNTEGAMQTLQRSSLNTINAVSSQAFSLRGDGNSADALKRVTGLSVEGGKYVYVRGLSDRYSKTTLNSANIPGLDPERNTVQMDLFPTSLLENIVVYKNFTPDLAGDFTGGLINIQTKDFPETQTFKVGLSFGVNTNANFNSNFLTYTGSSTDWLGYDNGARDFPAAALDLPSRSQAFVDPKVNDELREATLSLDNQFMPERKAPALPNHGLSIVYGDQKKLFGKSFGYIASLTYNRDFSGYENGTTGRYRLLGDGSTTLNQQRLQTDATFSDAVVLGGMFNASMKLNSLNKISLSLLRSQTGENTARLQNGTVQGTGDPFTLTRTLAYVQRALTSGQLRGEHSLDGEGKLKFDWLTSYTLSDMKQPDLRFFNTVYNLPEMVDPFEVTNLSIDAAEDIVPTRFRRDMQESNFDNQGNLSYSFRQWNGEAATIKAGGGYLRKEREFREQVLRYRNPTRGNLDDLTQFANSSNLFDATENPGGLLIQDESEDRNQYDSEMYIVSGYAMTELPLTDRLKSVFGVRFENTILDYALPGTRRTRLLDQLNTLPSLSLIYELQPDKMNLRANYSNTVARPTFREIAPVSVFDVVRNATINGNSRLEITDIVNLDLRWEVFPTPGNMVSVSGFYKLFNNPIELTDVPTAANKELIYQNVDNGDMVGVEVEFSQKLDFINPSLYGLSLGGNMTYIQAKVDIPDAEFELIRALDPTAEQTRDMFGQSEYVVNAFASYLTDSGLRASLSYNVQGERLAIVSKGGTPDVYEQPFNSLNAKLSYQLNDQFNLSVSAGNMLNSESRLVYSFGGVESPYNTFRPGRTFGLGLNYSLR